MAAASRKDECEKALLEFVKITQSDEACAHFFLQDVNWDLQPALERFFECVGGRDNVSAPEVSSEADADAPVHIADAPVHMTDAPVHIADPKLSLMSWNVDGLDTKCRGNRFIAVCYIISSVAPDVVFLQEMTSDLTKELKKNLEGEYNIFVATPNQAYFTVILLKHNFNVTSHVAVPYVSSGMGRAMQMVESTLYGRKLKLLNTHLESTKECSEIRKQQLNECFDVIKSWDDGKSLLVFGGDLNVRESEVHDVPPCLSDVWVTAGSNPETRFTWDTQRNDNKACFGARARFDRIYFSGAGIFTKAQFDLEGKMRIRSSMCFPSDHFALVVHLS